MAGIREVLNWADNTLARRGPPLTGPAVQRRTWNLAALFQLPTAQGPAWLKMTPSFATDEASVIAAFARVDPTLVPQVIGAVPRRVLLEHLPGEDCWDAPPRSSPVASTHGGRPGRAGRPILRPSPPIARPAGPALAEQILSLLDGPLVGDLGTAELAAARGLLRRFPLLDECGLPDTIVHGDFHPGNWRSDAGPPAVLDFADAYLGNPILDGLRRP